MYPDYQQKKTQFEIVLIALLLSSDIRDLLSLTWPLI